MTGALARHYLRIAAGLPHPSEAHAIFCEAMGDRAPAEIAKVRAKVDQLVSDYGGTRAQAWGDLIEAAGKRDLERLVWILAALHEAERDGEVAP